MSKLSNELLMLQLLSNGKKYSIKELSEKLEVSTRMVRTYKEDFDKAGIYIYTIRGPYGGYVLKNDFIYPKRKFNEEDFLLLSRVNCDYSDREALDNLKDKIKENCNQDDGVLISDRINNFYNILNCAIKKHRKVFISYYSYNDGVKDRIIHPLDIFVFNGSFGCAAYCELKGDLRHFDLDRIKNIRMLEDEF